MDSLFAQGYLARNPFQDSQDAFILAPDGGRKKPAGDSALPAMPEGSSREVRKVVVFTDIEGLTIENRAKQHAAIPDDVLEEIRKHHVHLKGPTTTPRKSTYRLESCTAIIPSAFRCAK